VRRRVTHPSADKEDRLSASDGCIARQAPAVFVLKGGHLNVRRAVVAWARIHTSTGRVFRAMYLNLGLGHSLLVARGSGGVTPTEVIA